MNYKTQDEKNKAVVAQQAVVDAAVGQPAIEEAKEELAERKAASVG